MLVQCMGYVIYRVLALGGGGGVDIGEKRKIDRKAKRSYQREIIYIYCDYMALDDKCLSGFLSGFLFGTRGLEGMDRPSVNR